MTNQEAPIVLLSPAGKRVTVHQLRPFCRAHGLDSGNLLKVIQGSRRHHRGWTCPDIPATGFAHKPHGIEQFLPGGNADG